MFTYMKGHKVPLSPWSLAVYWEEAVRVINPPAQKMADEMYQEYVRDFVEHSPDLLQEVKRLNKGFRPPYSINLIWWAYWNNICPMFNPLAVEIRKPYINIFFDGHQVIDDMVGLQLFIGGLVAAGTLNPKQVRRLRKPMAQAIAGLTNIPACQILAASQGSRAAHELLTQRVSAYNLVQERRLMLAALVFAARYSPGSGEALRTWDGAMSLLVERHSDLLTRLGLPNGYTRPSEARRAAMPFCDAFIKVTDEVFEGELQAISQ
jgi:hypothetical protein